MCDSIPCFLIIHLSIVYYLLMLIKLMFEKNSIYITTYYRKVDGHNVYGIMEPDYRVMSIFSDKYVWKLSIMYKYLWWDHI